MVTRYLIAACAALSIPVGAQTTLSRAMAVAHDIETVGFDTHAALGVGGMLTFAPTPVVLFRNGDALKSMRGLNAAGGLSEYKRERPQDWTVWRRNGDRIELMQRQGWKAIAYKKTMDPVPKGSRISGSFSALSGAGNTTWGGNDTAMGWTQYAFDAAGTFALRGGASASTAVKGAGHDASTTSGAAREAVFGRYEIAGYKLILRYDRGREEQHLIVFDPSDPRGAVWIDGIGYSRK